MGTNLTLEEVLEKLMERYPNELPKKSITNDELNFRRGQQAIIDDIWGWLEVQDNNRKKATKAKKG